MFLYLVHQVLVKVLLFNFYVKDKISTLLLNQLLESITNVINFNKIRLFSYGIMQDNKNIEKCYGNLIKDLKLLSSYLTYHVVTLFHKYNNGWGSLRRRQECKKLFFMRLVIRLTYQEKLRKILLKTFGLRKAFNTMK